MPISWKNCLCNSSLGLNAAVWPRKRGAEIGKSRFPGRIAYAIIRMELKAAVRPRKRGAEIGFADFLEELLMQFFIGIKCGRLAAEKRNK